MHRLRRWALLGLLALGGGCTMLQAPDGDAKATAAQYRPRSVGDTMLAILLYLPNRIFDFAEIMRFGVNVGPGVGIDAEATGALRAAAMTRVSVGLGYQGLRHLPVTIGSDTYVAVGPYEPSMPWMPDAEMDWYRSKADLRLEPHLLILGAHGAIDLMAIGDFFVGWLGFDPEEDDW